MHMPCASTRPVYKRTDAIRLHTNSRILHGIRSRRDVAALSSERAAYLRLAQESAGRLVQMALRGSSYATNFAKGEAPLEALWRS